MTNGNGEIPGDVGAGDGTDIPEADILQDAIDAELGAMATELDELLERVIGSANDELAAMDVDAIGIRTEINGAVGDGLAVMAGEADELRARLIRPMQLEVDAGFRDVAAVQTQLGAPTTRPFEIADPITGEPGDPLIPPPTTVPLPGEFSGDLVFPAPNPPGVNIPVAAPRRAQPTQCDLVGTGITGIVWQGLGVYGGWLDVHQEETNNEYFLDDLVVFDHLENFPAFPFIAQLAITRLDRPDLPSCTADVYFNDGPEALAGFPARGTGCFDVCDELLLRAEQQPAPPEVPGEIVPPMVPPPEIPPEAPVSPVPVDGECPPLPIPPVVAVDCTTGLLIVMPLADVEANDNLRVVGDVFPGLELDMRVILEGCGLPCPPDEEFLRRFQFAIQDLRGEPCKLPDIATIKALVLGGPTEGRVQRLLGFAGDFLLGVSSGGLVAAEGTTQFVVSAIATTLDLIVSQGAKFLGAALQGKGCLAGRDLDMLTSRFIVSLLNFIFAGALKEEIKAYDQQIAAACPTSIPTATEALGAFLANTIPRDTLRCWVEANNFRWDEWQHIAEAARQRPGMLDAIGMWRRGIIDREGLNVRARATGWTNLQDVEHFVALTRSVPGESDLVRFMQRDVDDPAVVARFGLDDEFAAKFGPKIREWARAQGVPDQAMLFHWRSHWDIPGNTALFAMLHRVGRNADGSIDPVWDDNIRTALKVNDVLPFFVDPLMKISFRLPRKAELSAAFRVGELDESEVMHEFVKRGMETPIARALTRTEVLNKKRAFRSNPLVTQYAKGNINGDELGKELEALGATGDAIEDAVDFGRLRMRMNRRDKCLAAIRHRVLIGEIEVAQARNEAGQHTQDAEQATELALTWECERAARSKVSTAAELCAFFKDRIITAPTYLQSLIRIGMPPDRADALVRRCQIQIDKREAAEERRQMDKLLAAAAKEESQREKTRKTTTAQVNQRAAALERANKARNRNQQLKIQAARLIAKRTELPYQEVLEWVIRITRQAFRDNLGTAEEIARTAKQVAALRSVTGDTAFERQLRRTLVKINA